MSVSFSSEGSFDKTERFLHAMAKLDIGKTLSGAAQKGVVALSRATPKDSGLASGSWGYKIERTASSVTIGWTNTDVENGFPVALMIQYGHGTGTGGYVGGKDYINPAMRPIFDEIAETVWKAVTSA
jgi:hypothetical protein